MTNHEHLVVELDESGHEQDGHIKISYKSLAWIAGSIVLLVLMAAGAFTGYLQILWKASQFEKLEADFERVRGRNKASRTISSRARSQMSQLENVAQTCLMWLMV